MSRSEVQHVVSLEKREIIVQFIKDFLCNPKNVTKYAKYYPDFSIDSINPDRYSKELLNNDGLEEAKKTYPLEIIKAFHGEGVKARSCMFLVLKRLFCEPSSNEIDSFVRISLPAFVGNLAVEATIALLFAKALLSSFEEVSSLVNTPELPSGDTLLHKLLLAIDACRHRGQKDYLHRTQTLIEILKLFGASSEQVNGNGRTPEDLLLSDGVATVKDDEKWQLINSLRAASPDMKLYFEKWEKSYSQGKQAKQERILQSSSLSISDGISNLKERFERRKQKYAPYPCRQTKQEEASDVSLTFSSSFSPANPAFFTFPDSFAFLDFGSSSSFSSVSTLSSATGVSLFSPSALIPALEKMEANTDADDAIHRRASQS